MPFCFFMIRDEALFRTINLAMSYTVYLVQVGSLRGKHQKGRGGECESKSRKREPSPFPLVPPFFLSSNPFRELWDSGVGKICNFVRKRRSHLRIGHFWVPKTLTFNEAKCISSLVKMSFICMRMKNHFHIKGWPLNLVLIQRPRKLLRPSFFSFLTWRIGCVSREICFNQS